MAIINTDGYKVDHRRQYPKETLTVVSNFTPRKSRIPGIDKVVSFGQQFYCMSTLIKLWNDEFFNKPFEEVGHHYYRRIKNYTSNEIADQIGINHIKDLHELGYLPLEIKAIDEGKQVPMRIPILTVRNTDDRFFWLTNYIETDLSAELWMPATSATTAHAYKLKLNDWAEKTGGSKDFVWFQGHDFSYRGMAGRAAAQSSGAGHLLSFYGTDTIPAIDWLEKYYGADSDKELVGCSVFATEHAVMCVGTGFYIKRDNLDWEHYGEAEFSVFKRLITELYPTGIVSIVSDTWNLWKVLSEYLPALKNEIMARDGKVVIRPDSGDPTDIICGRKWDDIQNSHSEYYQYTEKGVIECLWDIFGGTINSKGYKELDSHIGAIYGDSINLQRTEDICQRLADKKFASTNWVAGIGSYTYQYVTRDTFGFAMKATYAEVNLNGIRTGIDIFKDPITDDGTKKSAKGLIMVEEDGDTFKMTDQVTWEQYNSGALKTIFLNGKMVNVTTLKEIRDRLN